MENKEIQMKLTWEETKEIANRLDEIIGNNFHDAMYNVIWEREGNEEESKLTLMSEEEVSDEDILAIKEQLKRIL
jgi:hypothetical protein